MMFIKKTLGLLWGYSQLSFSNALCPLSIFPSNTNSLNCLLCAASAWSYNLPYNGLNMSCEIRKICLSFCGISEFQLDMHICMLIHVEGQLKFQKLCGMHPFSVLLYRSIGLVLPMSIRGFIIEILVNVLFMLNRCCVTIFVVDGRGWLKEWMCHKRYDIKIY